ncbi:N-acetyltransferase [Bacillus salacetis]|uniref:N-acetyltransferase n=1 Tax=Bacillus salacetis TaxID=2315464 RepID=A0A3A1QXQ5_9BACI|nr:GNAT family N-acetyltransferase [Bacillus salacetis]RIW33581.1 N-acetyltransferase [Bacillus salacetis]
MGNRILFDFPDLIETNRLYIRHCKPGDGYKLHKAINSSIKNLSKWMALAQKEQTVEEIEEGIRKSYADFILRKDFRLHIYKKDDGEFAGSTGFHRIDWKTGSLEIGYWGVSSHSGNGYITEAVKELTRFAFEHLAVHRVEIRCDELNHASRRIPERLGYTLEGTLRRNSLSADGQELRNTCVYSVLADEWKYHHH